MLADVVRPAFRWGANRLLRFGDETQADLPPPTPGQKYLLYLHVPFCSHLCPYCSFHRIRFDADLARDYFAAVRRELAALQARGFDFCELYVGGGTPTIQLDELGLTLELATSLFSISTISVETNPDHLVPRTFDVLAAAGVGRLSVGVQSFNNAQLQRMGRLEPYGSGEEISERLSLAAARFKTLNVDMMFNLPGQTLDELDRDIDAFLATGAGQVSFYPLMLSDITRAQVTRDMGRHDHRAEASMYFRILDQLTPTHAPSTVWCFSAGAGQIDEYIVDYPEYVGVGSGAFSYLGGQLLASSFGILRYHELLDRQALGMTRTRRLTLREQQYYRLMTRLFGRHISQAEVREIFGHPEPLIMDLLKWAGIVAPADNGFCLTRKGHYFWLVAMSEFLNGVNNLRDQMRANLREELRESYPSSLPMKWVQPTGDDRDPRA